MSHEENYLPERMSVQAIASAANKTFEQYDYVQTVWVFIPGGDLDFVVRVNRSIGLHFFELQLELEKVFGFPVHVITSAEVMSTCLPDFINRHCLPIYEKGGHCVLGDADS